MRPLDLNKFCAEPCKCHGLSYGMETKTDNLETLKYSALLGHSITVTCLPPAVV